MERVYMPPAEPPPLEHDTWGAPHPKAAVAGPPSPNRLTRPEGDINSLSGPPHCDGDPRPLLTIIAASQVFSH
jgi:hypothetical protein